MSISWAKKRQLAYGTLVSVVILIVGSVYVYFGFFNEDPTCYDRKQNGAEHGIDCGGTCSIACNTEVNPEPVLLWARPFEVAKGVNNLVAYLQNPNVGYVGRSVEYLFRVYDKENVLIGTRISRVTIPPVKNFAIFEQSFSSGERKAAKAFFEFTEPIVWEKFTSLKPELAVGNIVTTSVSTSPQVTAEIENKTINRYRNIEVVAVVYDSAGNAMAASKTMVDDLPGGAVIPLIFTWPEPFTSPESKVEIIPKLPIK